MRMQIPLPLLLAWSLVIGVLALPASTAQALKTVYYQGVVEDPGLGLQIGDVVTGSESYDETAEPLYGDDS